MQSMIIKLITIFLTYITLSIGVYANENLSNTKEIDITNQELIVLAESLGKDPVKIYNWVYNNIQFEDYELARKDALSVYWTRRGNEWDTSSLLIALFRISGIEARYLKYDYGENVSDNYVVVEAKIAVSNYRGNGRGESEWMVLTPWAKEYHIKQGLDLFKNEMPGALNFDFEGYVKSVKQETAIELYEKQLQDYLNIYYQGLTLKDIGGSKEIVKKELPILPLSKPAIIPNSYTSEERFVAIPNSYKVYINYYVEDNTHNTLTNNPLLSYKFYLSEIASSRVVLDTTDGYAKIKINGEVKSSSINKIGTDQFYDFHEIKDKGIQVRPLKNKGSIVSLGFDILNVSNDYIEKLKKELAGLNKSIVNSSNKEEYLGRYLFIMNLIFRDREYQALKQVSKYANLELNFFENSISAIRVYTNKDEVYEFNNNEKYLIHPSLSIDAFGQSKGLKRFNTDTYIESVSSLIDLVSKIYGYTASYNEGLVFEDMQSTASANTVKTLMIANKNKIPIVTITKSNLDAQLSILQYSEATKTDIKNAINENNAIVTTPIKEVLYETMRMTARLEFGTDYSSYFFNLNNGGASTNIPIVQLTNMCTISEPYFFPNQAFLNPQNSSGSGIASLNNSNDVAESKVSNDGDPVDMFSGEFYQEEKADISLRTVGDKKLEITRTYKSQLDYNGVFGYGWAWNHMERLLIDTNGDLVYVNNKGIFSTITKYSNSYGYVPGAKYTLSFVNNIYTLNFYDGSKQIFDTQGLLLEKRDIHNNKIIFEYDSNKRMSKIKDESGQYFIFAYDSNNKVTNISDSSGRSVSYGYAAGGINDDLTTFRNSVDKTTSYEYLTNQENPKNNHNMSKYILPNGDFLALTYYKNDQVSHHTNKNGDTFSFFYSRYNRYSETWNEEGYYRKVYFNESGDEIRVDKKDGTIETKGYDNNHNMISSTNANGFTTKYTYDNNRNILTVTNPLNETVTYTYNAQNKVTSIKDSKENITTFTYYSNNVDVKEKILADGSKIVYNYDNYGNIVSILDSNNDSEINGYDTYGINLLTKKDKKGNSTTFTYDSVGRIISLTNSAGYTKRIEYFLDDKIRTEIDELNKQTMYTYDDNGNIVTKTYSNGAVQSFNYYSAKDIVVGNLVKQKIDSLGNIISYKYDKLGNVIEEKDKRGNTTYYAYNELNKVITKTLPNQYTIHYTYDGVGNMIKEESSYLNEATLQNKTITTSYNYNSANRLISKITPKNLTINYEYDKNGNLTLEYYTINSNVVKTKYEYNALNQLVKLIKGFGSNSERITSYGYDTLGRKISETNAFGVVTQYQYDKNNNLLKTFIDNILVEENIYDELNRIVKHYDGNRNLIQYSYNSKNEKIQTIDAANNQYNYEYDSMGNLIKESFPNNTHKTYSYNLLGKPTSKTNNLNQTKYLSYDENMNVIRITDAKGNYTTYNYDALNQQISQTNAARDISTVTYDERGNIIAKQDFNGNLVTYSYDEANNKISQTLHLENETLTTTYNYDMLNRIVSVVDPKGATTTYGYNIYNENTIITDPYGITTKTFYDMLGRVEKIIDKKGITTQFVYNNLNQKIQTIQAFGTSDEVVTNFTYDTNGNLLSQSVTVDTNTIVTSYEYDSLNRLLNTKVDNLSVQSQTYDSVGNIASKIDGNGNTTSFTYDANNKPLTQTNPKGDVISYSYDENSNLISTITAEGVKELKEYDNLNRVTTTTIDNATKEFYYDQNGNIIKEMDYNGNVTLYTYDKANRVITLVKAANSADESTLSYTYDKNSNIATITDENGKVTTYSYDLLNRKVKHTYPSRNSKSFEYDNNDNISKITKEDGTIISQSYDNLNRLKTVSANGTTQQTFTYDALSRVISSKDTNSNTKYNTVTYTYDNKNNIRTSTQNGKTISKEYDSNSNLTLMTLPNNKVVKNSYDTVNNLASVSLGNSQIVSFTYNQDNQLQTQTTSNGTTLTLGYDSVGRETKRSYKTSSNNVLFSSTLTYDRNSNIIQEQIVKNNQTILKEYSYDSKDQIKSFAQTENSYRVKNDSYSYDKASNIIEKVLVDNVAHSNEQIQKEVNEDNQYTSIKSNSSNVTISYDANGNIKTYKDKTFTYDFLNRLISVKQNSTTLATYTYDASNRRVSKTVSNKTITYLYHNNQVVQEYENDTLTNTYLYGKYLDDPIAYDLKNVLYYYLKDSRYSIQAIINSNSTVVESYSYSPFGILTMYDVNQNVISNSNVNNTITFTGRVYDSESNLYYYRNRMYSPELARFISKDPKGYVDGMNLYAYVKNNPLRYLDPMGTTVREKFIDSDGQSGYVSYSASGRTEDYRIDYDNSNNFRGYSSTVGSYDFSSIYNTNTNDVVDYIENITMSGGNSNITFGSSELSDFYNNGTQNSNKTKFPYGILVASNDENVDWQLLSKNNNGTKSLTSKSNNSIVTANSLIKVPDSKSISQYQPSNLGSSIGDIASNVVNSIDKKDVARALSNLSYGLGTSGATLFKYSPFPQTKATGSAMMVGGILLQGISNSLDPQSTTKIIREIGIDVFIEFVPIPDYTKPFVSDIMKKTTNEFSGD